MSDQTFGRLRVAIYLGSLVLVVFGGSLLTQDRTNHIGRADALTFTVLPLAYLLTGWLGKRRVGHENDRVWRYRT